MLNNNYKYYQYYFYSLLIFIHKNKELTLINDRYRHIKECKTFHNGKDMVTSSCVFNIKNKNNQKKKNNNDIGNYNTTNIIENIENRINKMKHNCKRIILLWITYVQELFDNKIGDEYNIKTFHHFG